MDCGAEVWLLIMSTDKIVDKITLTRPNVLWNIEISW